MKLTQLLAILLVGEGAALQATNSRRPIRSTHAPKENVSNYEVVTPVITFSDGKKPHPAVLQVLISTETEKYNIVLELNEILIPPNFSTRSYNKDGREVITKGHVNCFYQGWVEGHPEWKATMSTCAGLKGTFGNHQHKAELYHLQPMFDTDPALEQAHALFLNLEYNEEPGTCGCNHTNTADNIGGVVIPDIKELNASGRIRLKRRVNGFWIVELAIVSDNRQYIAFGRSIENAVNRALEFVNIVDTAYELLGYRVILVESIVWSAEDQISIVANPSTLLNNFRDYKVVLRARNDSVEHDCLHLLTGIDLDGSTVGLAFTGVMCSEQDCASLSQDGGRSLGSVGGTVAHELGHNFNMNHDFGNCTCDDPIGYCIMAAIIPSRPATQWSTCSVNEINTFFTTHSLSCCLSNQPSLMVADPVCGNGLREGNEVCDCGTLAECTDPCCNATTCQLATGAQCACGECCTPQCTFSTAGTICRTASGTCDITEFCTGTSSDCPSDEHLLDGTTCTRNGASAFCYSGVCPNRDLTCQAVYGTGSQNGISQCYARNVDGTRFGHCDHQATDNGDGTLSISYTQCATDDVECGLMWCEDGTFMLSDANFLLGRRTFTRPPFVCTSYFSIDSDSIGAGYVANGNMCGTGRACLNRCCVLPSQLTTLTCPNGPNGLPCSGNGQCNNNGGCSCNTGFSGSTCQTAGAVTSPPSATTTTFTALIETNPPPQSQGGCDTSCVMGVVVGIILCSLIIGAVLIVFFCYWRYTKSSTLTHINFKVTVETEGEITTTSQTQPMHDGTIVSDQKDYDYPENVEFIISSMTKNKAYGDISSQETVPQTTQNLAYGMTSSLGGTTIRKDYNYPDNMELIISSMTKNEAYGDISSRLETVPQTMQNPAYGITSVLGRWTAEAMVHSSQDDSNPTTKTYENPIEPQIREETYDYARNPDLAIRDPPTVQNPAYGDITARAGDDQDYYVNEGLGGAVSIHWS